MNPSKNPTKWLPRVHALPFPGEDHLQGTDRPNPDHPYNAQKRFLDEVVKGLNDDVHYFVCLKARQLGISTVLLALDIFWLFVHPGLQGALITDTGANVETFRETITQMLESLPKGYRVPIRRHNKNALILVNGSRLQYMSAGTGKSSGKGLGISRALNFVHATELGRWGNPDAIDNMKAALAETNPDRLYMFESTAFGFNLFYDMFEEAKRNLIQSGPSLSAGGERTLMS